MYGARLVADVSGKLLSKSLRRDRNLNALSNSVAGAARNGSGHRLQPYGRKREWFAAGVVFEDSVTPEMG